MSHTIRLNSIKCVREINEGSASEEPYVLVTSVDLRGTILGVSAPNFRIFRYGVWEDFDEDEVKDNSGPPFWGLNSTPENMANTNDVIFIVSLLENDNAEPEQYRNFVLSAAAASLTSTLGVPDRSVRATRLLEDIRNDLNGVNFPFPFALDDDHIGTEELRLDSSDLIPAGVGIRDKSLTIQSSEGHYDLTFRINRGFPNWQQLDNNPASTAIVADGHDLYQLHNNGLIWKLTGAPLTGWQLFDNNPATKKIVAAGGNLYQMHQNGFIWKFTGTPLTGWQQLDNNLASVDIVAAGNNLYQIHGNGFIWRHTG